MVRLASCILSSFHLFRGPLRPPFCSTSCDRDLTAMCKQLCSKCVQCLSALGILWWKIGLYEITMDWNRGPARDLSNENSQQKIAESERYLTGDKNRTSTTTCLDGYSYRISDFSIRTSTTSSTTTPPRCGWCHQCKNQAHWTLGGLCKSCFSAKFHVARRKYYKECVVCKKNQGVDWDCLSIMSEISSM